MSREISAQSDALYPIIKKSIEHFLRSTEGLDLQFHISIIASSEKGSPKRSYKSKFNNDVELCNLLWDEMRTNEALLLSVFGDIIKERSSLKQTILDFFNNQHYLLRFQHDRALYLAEASMRFLLEALKCHTIEKIPKLAQDHLTELKEKLNALKKENVSEAIIHEINLLTNELQLIKSNLVDFFSKIERNEWARKPEPAIHPLTGRAYLSSGLTFNFSSTLKLTNSSRKPIDTPQVDIFTKTRNAILDYEKLANTTGTFGGILTKHKEDDWCLDRLRRALEKQDELAIRTDIQSYLNNTKNKLYCRFRGIIEKHDLVKEASTLGSSQQKRPFR